VDLDRFLVPKELVLHVTAVVAGLLALRAIRRISISWIDWLLAVYLMLSAVSAFLASNQWSGLRAVAITASGMVIFWTARGLREAGLARPLLNVLAFAVVLAAVTSLLQAYGIDTYFFTESRAPGGTLGNRNFVGHVAAFGLPIVLLSALRATRLRGYLIGSAGVAILSAALVLTRSRAAWVACAAVVLIFFIATRMSVRLLGVLAVAGVAVVAALLIPNALHWRSDNPYLESVTGVVNYEEGSGRGRLIQYERSLRLAAAHPILGVGPGNWPVAYPAYAARHDPSLHPSRRRATFNPWPSSDWVAFASERGFVAAMIMAVVFIGIAFTGLKRRDADDGLAAAALLATVAAAVLAGMFDAVLLLPLPTFLVWGVLGALWSAAPSRRMPVWILIPVIAVAAVGAIQSAVQLSHIHHRSVMNRRV
jgi:O-antigen ligase